MNDLQSLFIRTRKSKDWFVGLFAALHSGPDSIPRNTWLIPVVEKMGRIDASIPSLRVLFDDVGRRLQSGDTSLWPAPDDVAAVADFCDGYNKGAELHPSWPFDGDSDPNEEEPTTVVRYVFAALAGKVSDAKLRAPCEPPITKEQADAWRRDRRHQIPKLVAIVYERFSADRARRK